jgi:hypothetical protein
MISQVCLALNHTSFGEMIERCDSLGDLVERGEVAVVSDMDEFVDRRRRPAGSHAAVAVASGACLNPDS